MVTVKTKEELQKAIESGQRLINIEGDDLRAACAIAAKYQSFKGAIEDLKNKLMKQLCCGIIDEGAIVVITITICITAIAIIAILKKYNVKINYSKGQISVYK